MEADPATANPWLDPAKVARRKRPSGFNPYEADLTQDVPDDSVFPDGESLVATQEELVGPMTFVQMQPDDVDKVAVYLRELKYSGRSVMRFEQLLGLVYGSTAERDEDMRRMRADMILMRCVDKLYAIDQIMEWSVDWPFRVEAAMKLSAHEAGVVYRWSSYPQSLQSEFVTIMDEVAKTKGQPFLPFHPKVFTTVLDCCTFKLRDKQRLLLAFGLQPGESWYRRSPVKDDTCLDRISRAYHKIWEAEVRFKLQFGAGQTAVDLGAAPGGWTDFMIERGVHVLAVDRAQLELPPERQGKFEFLCGGAGQPEVLEAVRKAGPHDWILSDMNILPDELAGVVAPYAAMLKTGGMFVITVKLTQCKQRAKRRYARGAKRFIDDFLQLAPHFVQVDNLKWLLANRNERTIIFRKTE
jgi:23S rRNA U2552 (ribose-2'-O)-methylase RlmE/FtsJ